ATAASDRSLGIDPSRLLPCPYLMLRPGLQPVKAFTLHQQDRWRVFCTTTAEMSDSFHIGSIAKRQRQKQMIGVRSLFGIVILAFREMSVSCSFKYIVSNISAAA